jgi:hypothetical protein
MFAYAQTIAHTVTALMPMRMQLPSADTRVGLVKTGSDEKELRGTKLGNVQDVARWILGEARCR